MSLIRLHQHDTSEVASIAAHFNGWFILYQDCSDALQRTYPSTCCDNGVGRFGCSREESGNHRPVSGVATLKLNLQWTHLDHLLLGLLDYNSWYASPNKASNRPFQPGLEPNSAASDATVKRPELAPAEAGTLVAVRSVPGRRSLGQIVRMLHRGIESPKRQRDRSGVQTKRGVARGLCPGIRNLSDCEPDPYHSPILNRIPRSTGWACNCWSESP